MKLKIKAKENMMTEQGETNTCLLYD